MRKTIWSMVLLLCVCCILSACGCEHEWKEATCQAVKTCVKCAAAEGELGDHQWREATCVSPRICDVCKATEGEPLPHNWTPATCNTPKTCVSCGLLDGDALGHSWEAATCTMPKICSVCKNQEGAPLAHTVPEYETILQPTCVERGRGEGLCTTCGTITAIDIPPTGHTPGEWMIETEATYYAPGDRMKKCAVCEAITEEEKYELTEEEKESWYRRSCQKYDYKDIARNPDQFADQLAEVTCEISFVLEESDQPGELSYYYVYTKCSYGFYFEDPMVIAFDTSGRSRLVEGDRITVYGQLNDLYDWVGKKLPLVIGRYYDRKN